MRFIVCFLLFPILLTGQSLSIEIQQYFELKDFIEAEKKLLYHLINNPNDIEAIELLGDSYGHQQKWDEAIESYKTLIDSVPNNANYHYKYGGALGMKAKSVNKLRALSLIGDVENAFLKAANLDAGHIDARWALVHYYLHVPGIVGGSFKKAMQYAQELYALSPVDGFLAIGHVHEDKKEFEEAERNYKNAVRVGGSMKCYTHLIDFYEKQEEYDLAIMVLDEAYTNLQDVSLLNRKIELEGKKRR